MKKRRKPRSYEVVCTCGAYKFPHRFGGGKCSGRWVVSQAWEENYGRGDCKDCNLCNTDQGIRCEVLDGQENVDQCPIWQEFVRYNEVRIYG